MWLQARDDEDQNAPPAGPGAPPSPDAPSGGGYTGDYVPGGGVARAGGGAAVGSGLADRPSFAFGKVPTFTPPEFHAPSFQDALAEPGFQFRLGAGKDALERSAAAKGTLRTGGTLKDILEYGQNFGSQEYGNVFNRALQTYGTKYTGAHDAFAPKMAEYNLKGNAEMNASLAAFKRQWDQYAFNNSGGGGGGGGSQGQPEEEPIFAYQSPR